MTSWNSEQYLKFQRQRTLPAIDLAKRIPLEHPSSVLDIGCGPGNSTSVVRERFPKARVLGVDSSENMLQKARESYPELSFQLCDITTDLDRLGTYDVIFSNACLQWVPDHGRLIPSLLGRLNENGVLAVQIPMNGREPLLQIMDEVVAQPRWGLSSIPIKANGALTPEAYFDLLSCHAGSFDLWETVYYHSMPSVEAMVEWIKGTRLRPYLNALDQAGAESLEREIARRAASVYPTRANGEILFKFRRFFFIATAPR